MSVQYLRDYESNEKHDDAVTALAWSQDGAVMTGSLAGDIRLWNASTGQQIGSPLRKPHSMFITSLSLSRDCKRALSSAVDGSVALWDLSNVKEAVQNHLIEGNVEAITLIASVDSLVDKAIMTTDCQGVSRKEKGLESFTAALHPDGQQFVATGAWATVSVYSCRSVGDFAKPVRRLLSSSLTSQEQPKAGDRQMGIKIVFSTTGDLVAVGTDRGQVHLFDCKSERLLSTFTDGSLPIRALSFDEGDPNHLYAGSDDHIITIHDVRNASFTGGATVGCLKGHKAWVMDIKSAAGGRILLSCSFDGIIKVWDLQSKPRTCIATMSEEKAVLRVAWKPAITRSGSNATGMTAASVCARMASAFVTASDDGSTKWYRSTAVEP